MLHAAKIEYFHKAADILWTEKIQISKCFYTVHLKYQGPRGNWSLYQNIPWTRSDVVFSVNHTGFENFLFQEVINKAGQSRVF